MLTLVLVGDLLEEVVEVRPLEEPVEEPQEFGLVQHLEAAHRRLYTGAGVKAGAAVQVFLIGGHWPKILPQNPKPQLNVCTVYGVLFSPLWLKFVPGWPAIAVSS